MKKINIDPILLRLYYVEQEKSTKEVAAIFGTTKSTISKHLQYNGITARSKKEAAAKVTKLVLDKSDLQELYVNQQLSTYDIALQYKCDPSTIFLRLQEYGIPVRNKNDANKLSGTRKRVTLNPAVVNELVSNGLCIQEISEVLGVTYGKVYHWCKRNNIQTPSTSSRRRQQNTDKAESRVPTPLLVDMYWNNGMTFEHISEEVGLTPSAICLRLARNEIPARYSSLSRTQDFYKKHPELWKKTRKGLQLHTNIERAFIRWAIKKNLDFVTQYRIKSDGHRYDFYIPAYNTIVECDGDRWHTSEEHTARDNLFTKEAEDSGYIIYRFLGSNIIQTKGACFDVIEATNICS